MQAPIHVRVGEGHQILGARVAIGIELAVCFECLILSPLLLDLLLDLSEVVSSGKGLRDEERGGSGGEEWEEGSERERCNCASE